MNMASFSNMHTVLVSTEFWIAQLVQKKFAKKPLTLVKCSGRNVSPLSKSSLRNMVFWLRITSLENWSLGLKKEVG